MGIFDIGTYGVEASLNDPRVLEKELQTRRDGGQRPGSGALLPLSPSRSKLPPPPQTGASRSPTSAPRTALSGRSTSAPLLSGASADGREDTATSAARSSRFTRRSRLSSVSFRSKLEEVVKEEVARTAMTDYLTYKKDQQQRERQKNLEMPMHLRSGPNPLSMGCPRSLTTEIQDGLNEAIRLAIDPKWSTDIHKVNNRVGQRIEYQERLSASVTGAMMPELPYMHPKKFISNPPTPYWKPGKTNK